MVWAVAGPYDVVCGTCSKKLSWVQQRVQLGAPAMPAVGTMGVGWASRGTQGIKDAFLHMAPRMRLSQWPGPELSASWQLNIVVDGGPAVDEPNNELSVSYRF